MSGRWSNIPIWAAQFLWLSFQLAVFFSGGMLIATCINALGFSPSRETASRFYFLCFLVAALLFGPPAMLVANALLHRFKRGRIEPLGLESLDHSIAALARDRVRRISQNFRRDRLH